VHQTSVDRYVHFNKDVWRIECAHCGVLADDLGKYEAAYFETIFAGKPCSLAGDTDAPDHFAWSGSDGPSESDEQALVGWTGRLVSSLEAPSG
jgi:hypothetical protein